MPSPTKPNSASVPAGFTAEEASKIDEDYLYFLYHVHVDGDAYTVVIPSEDGAPPDVIRYEQPVPDRRNAGGPLDAGSKSKGETAPHPPSEKINSLAASEAAPQGSKRKAPDASPHGGVRSGAVPVEGNCSITISDHSDAEEDDDAEEEEEEGEGEEEEEEEEEEDDDGEEEDGLPALGQSAIGTEEAIPASETQDGVHSDLPTLKVVEEEPENEKGEMNSLNAVAAGTTGLNPLDKKEASSSKGHLAMPLNASELQGIIWPPHINERPNSVFKEKLIEFLLKPFTLEEYDRYYALATKRTPIVKERMTRNNVVYYDWTHEMNKSYFDWYPDLAEQFNLQRNNYANGLALLRGLFFWLQNITEEDQFMPWSDEFKKYRVVTVLD